MLKRFEIWFEICSLKIWDLKFLRDLRSEIWHEDLNHLPKWFEIWGKDSIWDLPTTANCVLFTSSDAIVFLANKIDWLINNIVFHTALHRSTHHAMSILYVVQHNSKYWIIIGTLWSLLCITKKQKMSKCKKALHSCTRHKNLWLATKTGKT